MTTVYVKFMKKEELINMLVELHTFTMKTRDGRTLKKDNRKDKGRRITFESGVSYIDRPNAFKMNAFDMDDVLISGEGYVRYNTYDYSGRFQGRVLEMYGFVRED